MIKGYKVFNPDWTCRDFQYKVGETFKHEGEIKVCGSGFHFCQKAANCFNYYNFDSRNKVAEVVAIGEVLTDDDKSVTDEIKIVREIPWSELLEIVNTGHRNDGMFNSGHRNKGNRNIGWWNYGNANVGDWNKGNGNVGDKNKGYKNIGNNNLGKKNTGDNNQGDGNTGDWNIIDYSTGLFNTEEQKIMIFDKPSEWTYDDWLNSETLFILTQNFNLNRWIYEEDMTEEEKERNPSYQITGGYLKIYTFKEACNNMWNDSTYEEKRTVVTELPNFDKDKFELITGIHIEESELAQWRKERNKCN